MHDLAEMLCQDKLVLRVRTANDEVAHLQDFEYGKSWALTTCAKKVKMKVECWLLQCVCSCHQWAGPAWPVCASNWCHHWGWEVQAAKASQVTRTGSLKLVCKALTAAAAGACVAYMPWRCIKCWLSRQSTFCWAAFQSCAAARLWLFLSAVSMY